MLPLADSRFTSASICFHQTGVSLVGSSKSCLDHPPQCNGSGDHATENSLLLLGNNPQMSIRPRPIGHARFYGRFILQRKSSFRQSMSRPKGSSQLSRAPLLFPGAGRQVAVHTAKVFFVGVRECIIAGVAVMSYFSLKTALRRAPAKYIASVHRCNFVLAHQLLSEFLQFSPWRVCAPRFSPGL